MTVIGSGMSGLTTAGPRPGYYDVLGSLPV
jgi:hypothetical protein